MPRCPGPLKENNIREPYVHWEHRSGIGKASGKSESFLMGPSNYYCFEGPRGTGIGKASERIDRNRSRHERPAPKREHADISHLSFGKSLASPILPEQYHGLLMILFRNRGSLLFYVVCSSLDPIAIVYPPELILGSLLRGP